MSEQQSLALFVLHALMGETKLVKECLLFGNADFISIVKKGAEIVTCFVFVIGGVVCLIFIFCCSQETEIREKAADVLSKMSSDKLLGPKVRIALSRFVPEIFLDAMKKSVEACIQMFEGTHENPELIWNDDARLRLKSVVSKLAER